MAEQSIACPSCGKKIPLTRALRAEIEASVKDEYDRQLDERTGARAEGSGQGAEKKPPTSWRRCRDQLKDQAKELEEARRVELALRKREQALERKQADLEVTIARTLAEERTKLVTETQERRPSSTG